MADSLEGTSRQEPEGTDQSLDQPAIDALFGKPGGKEPVASSTPAGAPAPLPPGVQEISQADIDALLIAASASPPASDAEPAAELDSLPADAENDESAPKVPDTRLDSLGRPFDDAAAAMQTEIEEERVAAGRAAARAASAPTVPPAILPLQPFALPDLKPGARQDIDPKRVTMLNDVNLRVKVELGRTRMLVEDVLKLGEGSVVELDKPAGDPVDVYVNDRLVARGEVLVLADNFCVRVTEVVSSDPHRVSA